MEPNAILHSFFLEFNLGFPDKYAYKFEFRKEIITIIFDSKKFTSRFQFGETETILESKDYQSCNFSLEGDDTPYQTNYFSENSAFSLGYLRRRIGTIVRVGFSTMVPNEDQEKFARACLDHFLDVYRLFSAFGNAENHTKLVSTLGEVENGHLTDNSFQTNGRKSILFSQSEPSNNLHSEFRIEKNEDQKINVRLQEGSDLEAYERIIVEAKRLLLSDDNFSMSIVVLETALEAFVQKKIKELCLIRSLNKLRYRGKYVKIDDVTKNASILVLINTCIPEITGSNVDRAIFDIWKSDLYDVRNCIIHRGALGHSKNQAEKAYRAMSNLIYNINDIK